MILMSTIRRVTLDEFWSRETGTVKGNLTTAKRLRNLDSEELGLDERPPLMGPYPLEYEVVTSLACTTLRF